MNFNTSVYPNVVDLLVEQFGISEQAARVGQMDFLVLYAFGSELWAPWSEEFGRWPIMQLSLFLVNMWQLPCALAPNIGSIFVARALVSPTRTTSTSSVLKSVLRRISGSHMTSISLHN